MSLSFPPLRGNLAEYLETVLNTIRKEIGKTVKVDDVHAVQDWRAEDGSLWRVTMASNGTFKSVKIRDPQ
jgi:hypothetical protein